MRKLALILALCLSVLPLGAQTTKVRGFVKDANTGEPIPFAAVFFKGTTIGITSDNEGKFNLETRDLSCKILCCQLLGFESQEVSINPGHFNQVDFKLAESENQLRGVIVKADNRRIKRLLANIDAHRDRNNPELRPHYSCDVYNKIELDLAHAKERLKGKQFRKQLGFVFDYMDTSSVSGVPYLPVMISETMAHRVHTSNPNKDGETITANRISGINPDANMLSQFTGSMHLKINFYNPFINSFDVEFPSPIQSAGLLFYNYFIVDSLNVDSRKTYLIRYHPKAGISSPAFDGEMQIDAEDFALRSIHAKMKRGGNVNWIRDIVIDAEYTRLDDSTWFYKDDKLYADFSIAAGDSSKLMSFIGVRQLHYSNPDFVSEVDYNVLNGPVKVTKEANFKEEEYWDSVRPYELTKKEKNIYAMVDRVKDVQLFKDLYSIVAMLVDGYWDIGPVGLGPYYRVISFNPLEGVHLQMGVRTSKDFSKQHRITGWLGYGINDKEVKGGVAYEWMIGKEPTRKLTLEANYDTFQLGRGSSNYTDQNLFSSIMGGGWAKKLCPRSFFSAKYDHEFSVSFNLQAGIDLKRYYGNSFVPMISNETGKNLRSIATNEAYLALRFSKDETVNRGHFIKTYLHSKYPVVTLQLAGSIPGIRRGDIGFFRPELTLDWKFRIPPVGMSKIRINTGVIVGQVPYPLLHLHEGNGTLILDKTAFSCMDYFEFASDTWATLF
ncbi:MAG: carboxypeptidase-like regulatory domain-containing protein, partial [Bacteroidales bacterium]|nr:carboxypeptidase-like regulatory domain-containing protein [Bacteroidales bacterium]